MLSDVVGTVGEHLWAAPAAGCVGDRAGAEWAAFAKRAREAPPLEAIAAGTAAVPRDPELIYFLGASCLARLGSSARADGVLAAQGRGRARRRVQGGRRLGRRLGARAARERTAALAAFEEEMRGGGSQVLVDVLRLGRFAREGAGR